MNNERKQKYLNKLMLELEELKKPIQISEGSYISINLRGEKQNSRKRKSDKKLLVNQSKKNYDTKKMNFLIFILFFIIIILIIIFNQNLKKRMDGTRLIALLVNFDDFIGRPKDDQYLLSLI